MIGNTFDEFSEIEEPPLSSFNENLRLQRGRPGSRRCSRLLGSRFYMTSKCYPPFGNEDILEESGKLHSPKCRRKTFVGTIQQFRQIGQRHGNRRDSGLSASNCHSTQMLTVGSIDCAPYISERGTDVFTVDNELTHRNSWMVHQNQAMVRRDSSEEASIYQSYTNPLFKSPARISYL